MPGFVGSLFRATCKINGRCWIDCTFMICGDSNESWKSSPAQLRTRTIWDALSFGMLRHAYMSQLVVTYLLYVRPVHLFWMVERGPKVWSRTYHLRAVKESRFTTIVGYSYSASGRYQQCSYDSKGCQL